MLYGMDDEDDDFEESFENSTDLIEKPHLNKKKVVALIVIVIAIIAIIISTISIVKSMSKPVEVSSYSFEDKISIDDPNISSMSIEYDNHEDSNDNEGENNGEENNEENTEENPDEDDTTYRENAGNSYYPDKTNDGNSDSDQSEVKTSEAKSGVYSGMHMQIPEHNLENIKNSFVPRAIENSQQAVKDIYFSQDKQVYLTFDDGPTENITPRILDILKEEDVPATFFVLGKCVDKHPELVKREYNEGHYIANHGYSHSYSEIYASKDTVYDEYVRTENSIKNALGNQNYNTFLFRFPGGSSGGKYENIKSEARELFKNYGVAFTNWNCLSGDAENSKTAEQCINRLKETAEDPSLIVLMHDASDKEQTIEALPTIIRYFKDEGYTFKNFYEIFK